MRPIFAFDYETYYSKTYSIRDLGNYAYTHHQEFDAYLLSVVGSDGYEYIGPPKDFDWAMLNGADVIAHNAGFERAVTVRLLELGIIKGPVEFGNFYDTADLAAYLGYPRSLAEASKGLLGIIPDKTARDRAKGLHWADMSPEFQKEMSTYALSDSRLELKLWLEHGHKWPEWERELSSMTRDMCAEGLPIDLVAVDSAIALLDMQLAKCRARIPWAADPETPALSKKLMAVECAKHNVQPPKSMAKDSEEFDEWLRQHGDSLPFAKAMGHYRSMNIFYKKLQTMRIRTAVDPNDPTRGIMPYSLKYGGAHTMRDSGDAGWNPQNLNRHPVLFGPEGLITKEAEQVPLFQILRKKQPLPAGYESVDMRSMITAPPGKILAVADLHAIEPCVLNWFAGDEELLQLLRDGVDPYEAQARVTKRYDDPRPLKEVNPEFRQYMKVEVLGLGYGAGAEKTIFIAKDQADLVLTLDQTTKIVADFRQRKFIPNLWKSLEKAMASSTPGDHEIELPSGRLQRYRRVKNYGSLSAEIPRKGRLMRLKWWGGSLAENITQAASRDVFMDKCIVMKNEGLPQILRVHDEAVSLFDEDKAEAGLKLMLEILTRPVDYMPGLPLSAEGHLCVKYTKS